MILNIQNSKESTKILLELINEFHKVQDTRSIYENQLFFYTVAKSKPKIKLRKIIPFRMT